LLHFSQLERDRVIDWRGVRAMKLLLFTPTPQLVFAWLKKRLFQTNVVVPLLI